MATIHLLEESTINRIAAGEVVERPLSVVRELVDNALDAGAESIVVEIRAGGHELIRVVDDGSGIAPDDIELAFERHATSKISRDEDLQSLTSYGFRGEALAAIASVSRIRLRSRHQEEPGGLEIELEGGDLTSRRPVAAPIGTEIAVQQLFFNTPARKKFLKTERGENTKITGWLKANALLHPEVRWKFIIDGKEKFRFVRRNSSIERAREVFPSPAVEIVKHSGDFHISGLLAAPHLAKATPNALALFVNRRLITDRAIVRAVREGFGGTVKPHQTPLGFLHIELPPQMLDVNVHPQKQEVRFVESSQIFRLVLHAVRERVGEFGASLPGSTERRPFSAAPFRGVAGESVAPRSDLRGRELSRSEPVVSDSPLHPLFVQEGGAQGSDRMTQAVTDLQPTPPESLSVRREAHSTPFQYRELRYLGTVLSCYLVCEYGEQLVIVDMHAAHERVNYNKILQKLQGGKVQREKLLIPLALQFDEELYEAIVESASVFQQCGFEVRAAPKCTIEVLQKPTWIPLKSVKGALGELAEEDLPADRIVEGELEKVAARLACHASIRSGDVITREEVYALFEALDEAEWSGACPHGRPVVTAFTQDELERRFGRQ
jgi:DNA mismatch repair protein MutL